MMYLRIILILAVFIYGCGKANDIAITELIEMPYPNYFPKIVYHNPDNKITVEGFNLGKRLFNDPILSIDSSVACVSCHAPEHAFADHNTAFSKGVFGKQGKRNAPALFNLAWHQHFNWDGGVNHLEVFPIAPIENPNEMAETMKHILVKLNRNVYYRSNFKSVFKVDSIEDKQIMYALTQFMLMLVSNNSKYDKVKRGEDAFTPNEQKGYEVFKKHCNSCHTEPLFMSNQFKNNGTETSEIETGRMLITQKEADRHKFKIPSLRNLKFTYPYMHNGKFWNLDAILNHYHKPKPYATNADSAIIYGIPLTVQERSDLLDFLNTLNDYNFIGNHLFK